MQQSERSDSTKEMSHPKSCTASRSRNIFLRLMLKKHLLSNTTSSWKITRIKSWRTSSKLKENEPHTKQTLAGTLKRGRELEEEMEESSQAEKRRAETYRLGLFGWLLWIRCFQPLSSRWYAALGAAELSEPCINDEISWMQQTTATHTSSHIMSLPFSAQACRLAAVDPGTND